MHGVNGFGLYLAFVIPPMLLGLAAQAWIRNAYARWSRVPAGPYTGADVVRQILSANGLAAMPIRVEAGQLRDHYDPRDRSIHLSADVAQSTSVAAVSVAAHETGHALQHNRRSGLFQARTALVAPVGLGSRVFLPILIAGVLLRSTGLVQLAIALFSVVVLFHLVTLPVEIDASRRARRNLDRLGLFQYPGVAAGSRTVLTAAAMTYVAGTLAAVAQLAYFLLAFSGRR